jgi:hypothetical protein
VRALIVCERAADVRCDRCGVPKLVSRLQIGDFSGAYRVLAPLTPPMGERAPIPELLPLDRLRRRDLLGGLLREYDPAA